MKDRLFPGAQLGRKFQFWQAGYQQAWQPQKSAISLLLIGSTILAVGATALLSYRIVRSLIIDSLKANALTQVQQAGDDIDQWLSNLLAQVEVLGNNSAVRSMNWSIAAPYLRLELEQLPDFAWLQIGKPDGSQYGSDK